MFSIFKQSTGSKDTYSARDLVSNPHYASIGSGFYVNKDRPEIAPMLEVASNVTDPDAAIELFIQISELQGRVGVRADGKNNLHRLKLVG